MDEQHSSDRYVWPTGLGYMELDTLGSHLRDTGRHYAIRALASYSSWDELDVLDAAVAMGTAVELLAKAMLAEVAPTLLLDRQDDLRSVMLLAGVPHPAGEKLDPLLVKTVSASQAVERLRQLRLIQGWGESDKMIFTIRNAAAHMALVTPEDVQEAIVPVVRFCDNARQYFEWESEAWWGAGNVEIVGKMMSDSEKRLALLISAKFISARQALAGRECGLPLELRGTIFAAIADAAPSIVMEHVARTPCPVCQYSGWAIGFAESSEQRGQDRVGVPDKVTTMAVEAFQCHVCGLVLDGWEQIAQTEIPTVLETCESQW